jgi:hypothetical protein
VDSWLTKTGNTLFDTFSFFCRILQVVFSSSACLNASFLNKTDHYATSSRYPGIDLKQARYVFELLSKNDLNIINSVNLALIQFKKSISKLSFKIIQMLTDLFNSLPESPPSIEALRLYVIAPLFHAFSLYKNSEDPNKIQEKQNIYMLFFAYAQSINRLRKEGAGRVLDYWFAWTGTDFFRKLVNVSGFEISSKL